MSILVRILMFSTTYEWQNSDIHPARTSAMSLHTWPRAPNVTAKRSKLHHVHRGLASGRSWHKATDAHGGNTQGTSCRDSRCSEPQIPDIRDKQGTCQVGPARLLLIVASRCRALPAPSLKTATETHSSPLRTAADQLLKLSISRYTKAQTHSNVANLSGSAAVYGIEISFHSLLEYE